jgi:hypothetical protein
MTTTTEFDPASVASLSGLVSGPVFARGDAGLTDEVACFNTELHHDPDVVVGVASEDDVAAALRFAREYGLAVHIHATGHGTFTPVTSGLIISTKRLDALAVDQQSRLATIGAGLRWRPVIDAAAPFGLAPVTGSSVMVGAVGYTLGGGLGPLARSHGFTSDWVRGFRVVTPAGEVVVADADTNAELFWALRGGKGGLGMVTEMTLALAPIPSLYAGSLFFDGSDNVSAALRVWVAWLAESSSEVTTSAALLRMPDLEIMPPPLRGRNLLNIRFAYPGTAEEGERLAAPLRAAAPVYIDAIGPLPLTEVHTITNDPEVGSPDWSSGTMLTGIDDDLATILLERLGPDSDSPFVIAELRHLGAATTQDTPETTSVGGREGVLTFNMIALDPRGFEAAARLAPSILAEIAGWVAPVTNVNFAGDPSTHAGFDRSWPPAIGERLATIRGAADPDRLLPFGPA